ncbi:MAG: AAA family ATPase [Syntrophaceae bacterium]|nr:AAA family ATPase [Syntrophaceae bacterium]
MKKRVDFFHGCGNLIRCKAITPFGIREPMYNEFYGLSEKPFELLPDPKFFFLTPSYREIIESITEGIKNRKGFISITGEVGTGKTTLIRYLLGKLETETKIKTVLIFHPTVTFKELLKTILLELDLEVAEVGKKAILEQLCVYLNQMTARNETLIILIDEAQGLSKEVMEELGMLPKIETLQIVFVGQPEFEDKLHSQGMRQLQQKIVTQHHIRLFSEEESKNYIDHRLRLVRSSSSQRFTPKALSMICSHAQGIPRLINLTCDNALLRGYSLSRKIIDVDIIREVIQEMEGPFPQRTFFSPIAAKVKEYRLSTSPFHFLLSKTSLIILSFLCLGGFVFLIDRTIQPRPAKTMDIQSLKNSSVNTQPSLSTPSPPIKMEERKESKAQLPIVEPNLSSSEILMPLSTPGDPLPQIKEEDHLVEWVKVKKGHTISSLASRYYRMVNLTLMDLILDVNPDIKDVHLILVDQKIKLPKIAEELLVIKTPEGTYQMSVGTFQRPDAAHFYSDEQVLKGKKIEILPRRVSPQDVWYRVIVGNFDNQEEALKTARLLRQKGLLPAFGGSIKN